MLATNVPTKQTVIWAASATGTYKRTVPVTTADPNAASFTLGFPPNTFVDRGAGGAAPDGKDVNGVLAAISAWNQWQAAGGPIKYDGTFQAAVGGYPKNAVVLDPSLDGTFWISTADNNTHTLTSGSGGTSWANFFPQSITGNAGSANIWTTARTITAGTEIAGNVTLDGSGDVTFNMTYSPANVNMSQTGHIKIGPLYLQWGRIAGPLTEQAYSGSFDVAFPNACLNMQATIENSASTNAIDYWAQVVTFSTTAFTVYAQRPTSSGATASGLYWYAIGF